MASLLVHPVWQRRAAVCAMAVFLAVLADFLFYRHVIGWTLGLFGAVVLLAVVVRGGRGRAGLWKSWHGGVAAVASFGIMLALVEEPSLPGVLLALLGIGAVTILTRQKLADTVMGWIGQLGLLTLLLFVRPVADWLITARWERRRHAPRRRIVRLATTIAWWFFPLLAGLIFFLLFAAANPIVESWLRAGMTNLVNIFDWLPQYLGPGRIFLWVMVAVVSYGLMRYRRAFVSGGNAVAMPPVREYPKERWFNGPQMIVRCLLVFNAVFGLETILDIVYLFGGRHLPAGMDYRAYAHRGAYPLIFTALIAGLFTLWAFRIGGPAQRSAWCRRLVYLWLLQNVFLLVSTFWRIWMYVEACLLTRWRMAAMIWVGLVALGFVWIIIKIAASKPNAWLWKANVLTLATVLYGCAFVNFDGLIAEYDVMHSAEYKHSDVGPWIGELLPYVADLGPEAMPALEKLRKEDKDPGHQKYLDEVLAGMRGELKEELKDWRGWTWRRERIAQVTTAR
jgi:hypothetical protein